MEKLWIKHSLRYQQLIDASALLPSPPSSAILANSKPLDPISALMAQGKLGTQPKEMEDEYKAYCALPSPGPVANLFEYWTAQEQSFPRLSKLAYNSLSIPAMSAECERVFSSCKIFITPHRNRLSAEAIEASECLRNWYRTETIQ